MKTKLALALVVALLFWFFSRIIFGLLWHLLLWAILIGVICWFVFGGISRIPAVKRFISKYDKE